VKRRHIYEMFKELVEGMYRDEGEARVKAEGMENGSQRTPIFG
jgi:hypothetical protein